VKRSCVLCLALALAASSAHAQDDELARARFLDQQGVRAFAENRFRDAMALFSASFRAGGPPTELWNVARCQLKLDNPEDARRTLEEYLDHKDLSDGDRAEGKRLLDEIERRPSTFVVASTPAGATVTVDGHAVGATPYASSLAPGAHEIVVARAGTGSTSRHVDARDGRAIVISVDLDTGAEPPKHVSSTSHHARRFSAELGVLGVLSSLGGGAVTEGSASPEVAVGFAPFVFDRFRIGIGVRVRLGFDQWSTSAGVSNVPPTGSVCASTPTDFSAVETLAMPTVFAAWRASRFVSIGARLGFGAAIYAAGAPIAGDLFAASCPFGGSLAPDGYAAIDVSLRMNEMFRVVFYPATIDIHPAYVGARSDATLDASGPWLRLGTGVAVAMDL
jgi:hypothetical protein